MPDLDLEERLRGALRSAADRVEPTVDLWPQVERRIHRARIGRWVSAGAVAAIFAIVAVGVSSWMDPVYDFAEPAPEDAGERLAAGPIAACGSLEAVAVVFPLDEVLAGQCVSGNLWVDAAVDGVGQVALTVDGSAVVHEALHDGLPILVHRDLTTGRETVVAGGTTPVVGPDGRLAWVHETDDGEAIRVGGVLSGAEGEVGVHHPGAAATVRRLAWDSTEVRLLYETIDAQGDSRVWTVRPLDGRRPRQELIEPPESALAAPAVAPDGTIGALSRCCTTRQDTDPYTRLELVTVDRVMLEGAGPAFTPVVDLTDVPGLDVDSDDLWLVSTGALTFADGTWGQGPTPTSWLVGDGTGAWSVDGTGAVTALPTVAGGYGPAAVNASASAPAERASPAEAVAVLRAADSRGEDRLAMLRRLLELPHGVVHSEAGELYAWLRPFARDVDEWDDDGHRA